MVWEDKSKYEGDWKDGMRHGKGTFYYTNGDKYVGDWKDDVQDGKGIYYSRTANAMRRLCQRRTHGKGYLYVSER